MQKYLRLSTKANLRSLLGDCSHVFELPASPVYEYVCLCACVCVYDIVYVYVSFAAGVLPRTAVNV